MIDTIEPPFENPWKALLFFGDHDFLPDGTAMLCTMQGDVWRVEGLDETLENVRWRRFASGLHQALGLVVADGKVYVLGRDQITRLHDLNGDGEADFYECFSNAYATSPAGHDFICGLQRDAPGRFYTASSKQGLLRISADGRSVEVVATGFRNPDGLGLAPDGTITVPNSEGEWMPASMICEVRPGRPLRLPRARRTASRPTCPLVYLPRGLDNSSGGQVTVPDDRFGPLAGPVAPLLLRHGDAFPGAAREGRRPAAGCGRAVARRVPLGRAPRPVQSQGRSALRLRDGRLGHVHAGRRLLSARALHRRAGPASDRLPRPRKRRAR